MKDGNPGGGERTLAARPDAVKVDRAEMNKREGQIVEASQAWVEDLAGYFGAGQIPEKSFLSRGSKILGSFVDFFTSVEQNFGAGSVHAQAVISRGHSLVFKLNYLWSLLEHAASSPEDNSTLIQRAIDDVRGYAGKILGEISQESDEQRYFQQKLDDILVNLKALLVDLKKYLEKNLATTERIDLKLVRIMHDYARQRVERYKATYNEWQEAKRQAESPKQRPWQDPEGQPLQDFIQQFDSIHTYLYLAETGDSSSTAEGKGESSAKNFSIAVAKINEMIDFIDKKLKSSES